MSEWQAYVLNDYEFDFGPGSLVLDVGCGQGLQMEQLKAKGCTPFGLDIDAGALARCRERGLPVMLASAERIPVADSSLDGVVCKVVIPLLAEDRAVAEFARILKPGGECYLVSHGAGFYLRYLLAPPHWKYRIYALRTLANTWLWAGTGRRLPGSLGDTAYQSRRRLARYYREHGLRLTHEAEAKNFLGLPVFIYQKLRKEG
jgi:ubiquinone/menaquinone biosynthesis C-methylase UbiE